MQYTAEFCNAQYNARAAVPDFADYFTRWRARSQEVRSTRNCFLERSYGDGPLETLDIFPSRGESKALLVFIHGGYWRSLDKSDFSFVAAPFIETGVTVALVNYELAPQASLFRITQQNCQALAWLHRHARDYGADPARLFVTGHSAGGHLTAMMLAALWPKLDPALPVDLVKGGLAISGLYDLEPLRHAPFLSRDINLDADAATHLSPACLVPATSAPLYLAVGEKESAEFHRQAALLGERWKSVFRETVPMRRANHFSICDGLADKTNPLHQAALRMMGL